MPSPRHRHPSAGGDQRILSLVLFSNVKNTFKDLLNGQKLEGLWQAGGLHRSQVGGWAPVIAFFVRGFDVPGSCELLPQGLMLVGPGGRREMRGLGGLVCCVTSPSHTDPIWQGGHKDEQGRVFKCSLGLGTLSHPLSPVGRGVAL